jgi:hypothetical protein
MKHKPDGSCLDRMRIRQLELPKDLRFTEHHRIEAGGDAKQVPGSSPSVEPIQNGSERREIYSPIGPQELNAFTDRTRDIGANTDQFNPVAGGEQNGLGD